MDKYILIIICCINFNINSFSQNIIYNTVFPRVDSDNGFVRKLFLKEADLYIIFEEGNNSTNKNVSELYKLKENKLSLLKSFNGENASNFSDITIDNKNSIILGGTLFGDLKESGNLIDSHANPSPLNGDYTMAYDFFSLLKYSSKDSSVVSPIISGAIPSINSICTDNAGNIYIAGVFSYSGSIDYLSSENVKLDCLAQEVHDRFIFLLKLDSKGKLIWQQCIKSINPSYCNVIKYNSIDNRIYFCGHHNGIIYLGKDTLISKVGPFVSQFFVSCMDTSGKFIWSRNGVSLSSLAPDLEIDLDGNIWIAIQIRSGNYFEIVNKRYGILNEKASFLIKYNGYGEVQKVIPYNQSGMPLVWDISLDQNQNLWSIGSYTGKNILFGNFLLINQSEKLNESENIYKEDLFIVNTDTSYKVLKAYNFGGKNYELKGYIEASKTSNSVYIVGKTIGSEYVQFGNKAFPILGMSKSILIEFNTSTPVPTLDLNSEKSRYSIYPNPLPHLFSLSVFTPNVLQSTSILFSLYDIYGNTVFNSILMSNNINRLNTSHLSRGFYIYTIVENGKLTKTGKIYIY